MKNSKTKAGNIFASIKEEEEKEDQKVTKKQVESTVNNKKEVDSAIKKPETLAKSTKMSETAPEQPLKEENSKPLSDNPGINYLNNDRNQVESPVNNGLLYIVPTKKKTRNHRKGFLLSDLALNNLQKEAAKYEISENELINQILEKMI
ncbi:MAG: hypothetical protein PUG04_00550 [Lachnospiraceae bacterium]|nr:hypothetical protein [Lachnospiraceae bacterium]